MRFALDKKIGLPRDCKLELRLKFKKGKLNLISDVSGITVGHKTIQNENANTSIIVIYPHQFSVSNGKALAGCSVINGFGKSCELMQIDELGTIKTPIVITNTLSVDTALTSLTKYMLSQIVFYKKESTYFYLEMK